MSGRKSREYRTYAMMNARRNNVFKAGADGFMKWYRRLMAAIFPKARRKYNHTIGWWFKRWIKHEAKRIAIIDRDPDTKAFMAARKKMAKARYKGQIASRMAAEAITKNIGAI